MYGASRILDDLDGLIALEDGLKITLNLQPSDGVRAFEDAYEPRVQKLGIDYKREMVEKA